MSKKDKITIEVTTEQIRAGLQKLIRSEHSALITQQIIDNLSITDQGLSQLYQALSGVRPHFKFKVLDTVFIPFDSLATWRMNKENMTAANILFKDKVKGVIKQVDTLRTYPYLVEYTLINDTKEESIDETWVKENYLWSRIENELIEHTVEGEDLF
jgi:hypothetical protein